MFHVQLWDETLFGYQVMGRKKKAESASCNWTWKWNWNISHPVFVVLFSSLLAEIPYKLKLQIKNEEKM